ncbi:Potassium channel subfamily K member 18 [Nymphon striatum]|nr:Potassium channel subfamily K member 18 [Nymphon striatum]
MERKRSSRRSNYSRYQPKQQKRSQASKCKECCRKFTAFMFSHVGVCVLVVGYSIMGAFAFKALEASTEQEQASQVNKMRKETLDKLWDISIKHNSFSYENFTKDAQSELKIFQHNIVRAFEQMYKENCYGNIAPRTPWGKIVTMLYAIIGIPVMFLYLANIGGIFAKAFKYVYNRMCNRSFGHSNFYKRRAKGPGSDDIGMEPYRSNQMMSRKMNDAGDIAMDGFADGAGLSPSGAIEEDYVSQGSEQDEMRDLELKPRESVPITLSLVILVVYISGGAALFSLWEGWDYLDGSYFCFITLSTIGFGDLVPGSSVVSDGGSQEKLVFCSLYLLIGLAVIAMCFNLMQEEVVHKVRGLGMRIGIIKDPDA